jgi:hypothetical protein
MRLLMDRLITHWKEDQIPLDDSADVPEGHVRDWLKGLSDSTLDPSSEVSEAYKRSAQDMDPTIGSSSAGSHKRQAR